MEENRKKIEHLVVDTTAFIQNAPLQEVAQKMVTCQDVVDEIKNKRQLRRLVVLPYDLEIKDVFPENVKVVTDFAIKTGDYVSLSATDIKVMALVYQMEKEHAGTEHIRTEPIVQKSVSISTKPVLPALNANLPGFYMPDKNKDKEEEENLDEENDSEQESEDDVDDQEVEDIVKQIQNMGCNDDIDDVLISVKAEVSDEQKDIEKSEDSDKQEDIEEGADCVEQENIEESEDSDEGGWITPSNVGKMRKQMGGDVAEEKHVKVACMTTDFAMQNVLKQMNLNVAALDGRVIKYLRTFILRCYACFKTTSVMTLKFCPKCGNNTLKKVAVSLDENGQMQIHINSRRPLTARGKKFSLPRIKGGKHPNNPILVADQPMAHNRPSRIAKTKTTPLSMGYVGVVPGYSPFVQRDTFSRAALINFNNGGEFKHWMQKNPNESKRKRK